MAETDQIKKDMFLRIDGNIYLVTERKLKTQGRQGGLIIFSAKNAETGQIIEQTVKAGTKFEQVIPDYKELQFIYKEGEDLVFMETSTFENITISGKLVGNYSQYMKEGEKYVVLFYDEKPLSLRENPTVQLKVTESVDAVKGNTSGSATKLVTTETGYKVNVPLFVNQGDTIVINTESGQYTGRA